MTEDDVVTFVRAYIEGRFPRNCSTCGRRFGSLREYLQLTTHVGSPVLYDDLDNGIPEDPLGPLSLANCECGTTLSVWSEGIPRPQLIELLTWAKLEAQQRSISISQLLHHLRDRIDRDVLEGGPS